MVSYQFWAASTPVDLWPHKFSPCSGKQHLYISSMLSDLAFPDKQAVGGSPHFQYLHGHNMVTREGRSIISFSFFLLF